MRQGLVVVLCFVVFSTTGARCRLALFFSRLFLSSSSFPSSSYISCFFCCLCPVYRLSVYPVLSSSCFPFVKLRSASVPELFTLGTSYVYLVDDDHDWIMTPRGSVNVLQ